MLLSGDVIFLLIQWIRLCLKESRINNNKKYSIPDPEQRLLPLSAEQSIRYCPSKLCQSVPYHGYNFPLIVDIKYF